MRIRGTPLRSIGHIGRLQRVQDNDADYVTAMECADRQYRRRPEQADVMLRKADFHVRSGIFALLGAICIWGMQAMAADGLTTVESMHGPQDTMERLETEVKAKGLTVFARVDHAAGAAQVGLQLRPTLLLIFGNAKGGTPLMETEQTAGIDLPLKMLVWQDAAGKTWLSYNDPGWMAARHALGHDVDATVGVLTGVLGALAKAATSP